MPEEKVEGGYLASLVLTAYSAKLGPAIAKLCSISFLRSLEWTAIVPALRILFLNKTRENQFRHFGCDEIETLRGGEATVLYLAEALGLRGHEVVIACLPQAGTVPWGKVNLADPDTALAGAYDVAISNNHARAFKGVKTAAKVIWTHNPGFSWTHVKADYLGKLVHRAHIVHLSDYTRDRSWFLPRSGETIIHHGMPRWLLDTRRERTDVPPPVAVFSSYAVRNLSKVIEAWAGVVHRAVPAARLLVTAKAAPKHVKNLSSAELAKLNIEVVGTLPRAELMELFQRARVLVAPGHFQETYNLLSIEAAACGVPVVTMGIGSLKERVVHDQTGLIAASVPDMGQALVRVLTDDTLWWRYHRACLSHPDLVSWDEQAAIWESYLLGILNRKRVEASAERA